MAAIFLLFSLNRWIIVTMGYEDMPMGPYKPPSSKNFSTCCE